ncbi:lysin [Bacillus wiedmannii]|uniref:phage tail spike protein n=1 Tax=Bacillus wiedmannii TaxID=1890302 RepID=UPI000BFCD597|nr:phage tail spike protein [Bacillus wiedmannii]PHB06810.1 lysin [Bacillus wiedmannii]
MYNVTIINDDVPTTIHSSHVDGVKLSSGVVKKEVNLIDSFDFSFHMNNPGFRKIKPLRTLINVFNTKTGKYEFEGRILGPSKNMDNSGLHSDSYVCEGELGYLHDSVQRHSEFRGTPQELFTQIIDQHNKQVEDYKKFRVGRVIVTNSTNNLYLYLSAEKDTFDTIKEKLLNNLGGELQVRKENGSRFLDYVVSIGEEKNTEIRIAKNLVSMSCDIDPTQIVTRLTPLGTRIKSEEENATDASEARLTIESVNNGSPYIDDKSLIDEFGIQGGSVTWDDVTIPSNLLVKGRKWLSEQKVAHVQYKISAVDLFLIGLDMNSFEVGNSYPVKNPVMGINEKLRVIGKSIDINSPQGAGLTIGDKFKTLNQYQNDLNKSSEKMGQLQYTVSQLNVQINSLQTTLNVAEEELKAMKEAIGDADLQGVITIVNDLERTLKKIEGEIQNLPTTELIGQIQTELQEYQLKVIHFEKEVEKLGEETKGNKNSITDLQTTITLLEKRVGILENRGG